ncbi:hypothetical protein SIID45300_01123 [Candidatus Magnetaquicoccaceae bacterium FCR-1]|uniref:Cytochrome c domain-containing protein n=1 Tax=Candidatus Magnetaquiglobus chichijimensis TaxID=3141448 RepID=A0ABQ0C7G0_9PROT
MYYDRITRLLHLLIALGIAGQMLVSLVMIHPKPGRAGDSFYAFHETWGVVLLVLLVSHWMWRLVCSEPAPLGRFFPWFSSSRLGELWADGKNHLVHARQGRLPNETTPGALACAVQGLGLLAATALGVTGTIFMLYVEPNVRPVGWLHDIKEVHEGLGVAMWAYLGLHAGMGIVHQWVGHGSLVAMFRFWEKAPKQTGTVTVALLVGLLMSGTAWAGTPEEILAGYRAEGAQPFEAERGRTLFAKQGVPGEDGRVTRCTSCHTEDPRQAGKHLKTGKTIEPLAPVANRERLSDPAKVEKWFGRNCKETLGRPCSVQEKGDFITWLLSVR